MLNSKPTYEELLIENEKLKKLIYDNIDISKRKQVEEELRESEEKFRALYNNAPLSYQSLNEDGTFKDINPTWLNTLGYERDEVVGKCFKEFLHPDWQANFEDNFPKFKKRGYVNDVQYKIRHKKGYYIDISFEGCIGYNPDGSFKQTYCVFKDITEQKKAEEALEESEEHFRALIEYSSDVVSILDEKGFITYESPSHKKVLGYASGKLLGVNAFELVHSDDRERISMQFASLLKRPNEVEQVNFRFLHKKGTWLYIEGTATNLIDSSNLNGIVVNYRDITERRELEKELKESEEKFSTTFRKSPIPASISKISDSKYIEVNEAWCRFLEFPKEEAIGYSDIDLNIITADANKNLQNAFLSDGFIKNLEMIAITKNGTIKHILSSSEMLLIGGEQYALNMIVDITERKKAEEKIRAAEKNLKNTFDLSPSIISKANLNTGYFIEVNNAVKKILGYSVEEFISIPFMELIHEDDRPKAVDGISEQLTGKDVTSFENRYLCKDGSYKWIAWFGTKADENGIVNAIGTDIHERKMAEQELTKHRENLEDLVKERTNELEMKNNELERFNDLFVDREFRIKELKEEIKKLKL